MDFISIQKFDYDRDVNLFVQYVTEHQALPMDFGRVLS